MGRKRRILTVALMIVLAAGACVQAAGDDWEYWPMVTVDMKLNDKWSLHLLEEGRLRHDMGDYYTHLQYWGARYAVDKSLDLTLWYKPVNVRVKQGEWDDSHRVDMDAEFKWVIKGLKLSNRTRFEHNTTANTWVCRDRVKLVGKKINIFKREYQPYVSNEFFWDIYELDGYHENRAQIGFSTDFVWDSKLTIYYQARGKKSGGDWTNANVLGTGIGFSF